MKAGRCDGAWREIWSRYRKFPASRFSPAHCSHELLRHLTGSVLRKDSPPRVHTSWSGLFHLSFVRKAVFVKAKALPQKLFSQMLPGSESPIPTAQQWVAEGTRWVCTSPSLASLLPASLSMENCLKVSFLSVTEWKPHLKMSAVFHEWHFFFSWLAVDYRQLLSVCLPTALVLSSAESSSLLQPTVNPELKHLGNCITVSGGLICQWRVVINAANVASGYRSLNSPTTAPGAALIKREGSTKGWEKSLCYPTASWGPAPSSAHAVALILFLANFVFPQIFIYTWKMCRK